MVSATNKNSAIGVLFDVDHDVIVKYPCFQRGSTLNFLKNFRTFFREILVQRHGVIISVQPIRKQAEETARKKSNVVCLLQWSSFCLLVFP